jgi:predicted transcriptional regulator
MVWTTRHGGRLLHFTGPKQEPRSLVEAHVLDELDRSLLAFVREQPRTQKAILAQFPDWPRSTVQMRLRRLVGGGFLAAKPAGRFRIYATTT